MKNEFNKKHIVNSYEVDYSRSLRLDNLFMLMQDVATIAANELGVGKDKLDMMIGISGLSDAIENYTPIVLASFTLMTCTTHPSISLEGSNAWIMKTIPVSPVKIFLSKIMVNLTVSIPFSLVAAILLKIYLKLNAKIQIQMQ